MEEADSEGESRNEMQFVVGLSISQDIYLHYE